MLIDFFLSIISHWVKYVTDTISISSYHMYTFYLLLAFLFKHDYAAGHVANVVKDFSVRNNSKRRQIDINVYSIHLLMSI